MQLRFTNDGKGLLQNAVLTHPRYAFLRNFSGEKEGKNDTPGKRYFHVLIEDPDVASKMLFDHWPVKVFVPKEDPEKTFNYMKVTIKPELSWLPCIVRTYCGGVLTTLDPESYKILDTANIDSANLTLRLWEYRPGEYSAQLEEGIFTIQPLSYWEDMYAQEEHPFE